MFNLDLKASFILYFSKKNSRTFSHSLYHSPLSINSFAMVFIVLLFLWMTIKNDKCRLPVWEGQKENLYRTPRVCSGRVPYDLCMRIVRMQLLFSTTPTRYLCSDLKLSPTVLQPPTPSPCLPCWLLLYIVTTTTTSLFLLLAELQPRVDDSSAVFILLF